MKVLITGGTGLLGQALVASAPGGERICVLHRRDYRLPANGVEEVVLDVLNPIRLADRKGWSGCGLRCRMSAPLQ